MFKNYPSLFQKIPYPHFTSIITHPSFTGISPIFRYHITTISPPYHQFTSYFSPIFILFIFYFFNKKDVRKNEEYNIAVLEMAVKWW